MAVDRSALKQFSVVSGNQVSPNVLLGIWENELGSTMVIDSVSGSTFTGTYASAVSSQDEPVEGSLVGTTSGDSVGFLVNWSPTYQSTTSWSGILLADTTGGTYITTLWYLASTPDEPDDVWQSIRAGANLFSKVS